MCSVASQFKSITYLKSLPTERKKKKSYAIPSNGDMDMEDGDEYQFIYDGISLIWSLIRFA